MDSDTKSRVNGLASLIEKSAKPAQAKESAVSSLASRFESAVRTEAPPKGPSSKIASMASTFDSTSLSASAAKPVSSGAPKRASEVTAAPALPARAPHKEGTVSEASRFNDAAALFSRRADAVAEPVEGSAFKNAASAFKVREAATTSAVSSKVSAFAQKLEKRGAGAVDASSGSLGKVKSRIAEQETNAKTSPGTTRFGATAARFETSSGKKGTAAGNIGDSAEGATPDRFKQASALFAGDITAPKDVDETGASGASRFANASKLFGGAKE
jgi:hypothetical protein